MKEGAKHSVPHAAGPETSTPTCRSAPSASIKTTASAATDIAGGGDVGVSGVGDGGGADVGVGIGSVGVGTGRVDVGVGASVRVEGGVDIGSVAVGGGWGVVSAVVVGVVLLVLVVSAAVAEAAVGVSGGGAGGGGAVEGGRSVGLLARPSTRQIWKPEKGVVLWGPALRREQPGIQLFGVGLFTAWRLAGFS